MPGSPDEEETRLRLPLDRVRQFCKICREPNGTHVVAAWLSLTRVYLETECPACGWTAATCFDLLKVDEWLRSSGNEASPKGINSHC